MTRAEAWAIHRKGMAIVADTLGSEYDPDDDVEELGYSLYGYTTCETMGCEHAIPIVGGMAPEFCPACDPDLEDD